MSLISISVASKPGGNLVCCWHEECVVVTGPIVQHSNRLFAIFLAVLSNADNARTRRVWNIHGDRLPALEEREGFRRFSKRARHLHLIQWACLSKNNSGVWALGQEEVHSTLLNPRKVLLQGTKRIWATAEPAPSMPKRSSLKTHCTTLKSRPKPSSTKQCLAIIHLIAGQESAD
jgi:hypothetical protein